MVNNIKLLALVCIIYLLAGCSNIKLSPGDMVVDGSGHVMSVNMYGQLKDEPSLKPQFLIGWAMPPNPWPRKVKIKMPPMYYMEDTGEIQVSLGLDELWIIKSNKVVIENKKWRVTVETKESK